MSYDEGLAARIRNLLGNRRGLTERKMFGGLAFVLRGNMCCGVLGQELIVRVGIAGTDAALAERHTRPFDFTGRPMRGWVVVTPAGCEDEETLADWIERGVEHAASLPPK